jgi:hypothetical protein
MSKGGSLFCRAAYLEQEARRIFRELEQEQYLKQAVDWTAEKFAERLAHYQSELIALHPFYELNGRITRLFFDLIAVYNGYAPIDYSQALTEGPSGLNAYIEASIQCVQRADNSKLQKIILRGVATNRDDLKQFDSDTNGKWQRLCLLGGTGDRAEQTQPAGRRSSGTHAGSLEKIPACAEKTDAGCIAESGSGQRLVEGCAGGGG